MIGDSLAELVFIRACIVVLHSIAPLSIFYCAIFAILQPSPFRLLLPFELYAASEAAFYFVVYLPRKHALQKAAEHPTTPTQEERRELFQNCFDTVTDPERYLVLWFRDCPLQDIKRDNVKELFSWAFLNKADYGPAEELELEEYADKMEKLLGYKLAPGRGTAVPIKLTFDKAEMLHRSLLWYFCVSFVDGLTFMALRWHGFHLHRQPLLRLFREFPFRLMALTSSHKSGAKSMTYWHRHHTSKSRLPILFIHGIGIGLYPYVNCLVELNQANENVALDGDVGIIALEIMPISFRITNQALGKDETCAEIKRILKTHGWDKVVLVSHSFGSVITTHLLKNDETSQKIGPVLLIDPVSILLHHPDVAYNFTYRKPKRANEHLLYYFASMDMGVSHTLARRFFWSENILWKHDIEGRRVTVSLAGRDLIVNAETVARYLTQDHLVAKDEGNWKQSAWQGKELDVLWFDRLDHAQVFDSKKDRNILVQVIRAYCTMGKLDSVATGNGIAVSNGTTQFGSG